MAEQLNLPIIGPHPGDQFWIDGLKEAAESYGFPPARPFKPTRWLADGDTVVVVKDLKVKGRPTSIKVGTKVRNIRLVRDNGDHDIDCKVDGFGAMYLKSSVVKKSV